MAYNNDGVVFMHANMKAAFHGGNDGPALIEGPEEVLRNIAELGVDLKNLPTAEWGALVRACIEDCEDMEALAAFKSYCDALATEQTVGYGASLDWETIQMLLATCLNRAQTA